MQAARGGRGGVRGGKGVELMLDEFYCVNYLKSIVLLVLIIIRVGG